MDRRTRRRAGLVVSLLLASLAVIFFKIEVSTDLKLFLPEPSSVEERLLHYELDNGASTNLVFIALTGLPPEQLAEANRALTDRLSASTLFRKVANKASKLGDEALAFVVDNRYLLSHRDLDRQLSETGLRSALDARVRGLGSPQAALEKRYLRQDPTGETLALLEDWQGKLSKHARPEQLLGLWFSKDRTRTLILAEIRSDVTRLEIQQHAIDEIRDAFDGIARPGLRMIMTGPAAFAVESREDIRRDVMLLTWLAVAFVTLFLWLVYRSVGMLLLIFAPLLAGVAAATAGILLIYGQIHGITLAFGITLAGVAVDYPIHLLTGLTHGRDSGNDGNPGHNLDHVSKIWPTLRLGVLSTVIAYAAFLFSGFAGLQQLGLFTIIGLVTASLFSRWCLPLLLSSGADRRQGLPGLHRLLIRFAVAARRARPLVLVLGAAGLLVLVFSSLPVLHLNVDSLSPIKESRRAEGKMLRGDLGYWYGGRMLIVTASDKEGVLRESERIAPALDSLMRQDILDGYDMASQFLPSQQRQSRNIAAFEDPEAIAGALQRALEGSKFRPGVFDPFLDKVGEMQRAEPIDVDSLTSRQFGRRLKPLIFDFQAGAAGVVLLHGVKNESAVRAFSADQDHVLFMHLKTSATALVARSVNRVGLVMIVCIVLIYLALWLAFRSPWRPLKIMVPTFSAAIVTATLLVLFGCPLSIFHLISLMLVIGLGLDYALFFNRLPDNGDEWNTTFKSLWVCGATTILVFGILVLSQTPPLRAIGMTVGIGASLAILFAAMWSTVAEKTVAGNSVARLAQGK